MYHAYRGPEAHDQRFPFLPFLAGLAVSPFLYGPRPFYGPRPYYYPRPYYPYYGYPYGYPYGGYYGY
ncbi:penicillin-binding protein [Bacillus pinisoli]|uniref:penicillin-binding protein n=1 Tax=Bacillus pinisoli TaxID=2901866 RepID=UPI001FF4C09B|nr:penicillin-binding protein [Bacillus pinisoli]